MQEYTIEKDDEGVEISRENCGSFGGQSLEIKIISGLCRADKNNPSNPRDITWYDNNVLKPMIEQGKISDGSTGPFDDRKMRYDGAYVNGANRLEGREQELIIYLGHSNFLDYREKGKRTAEEAQQLTQLGLEKFNDPYAFYGRNPGVTGIVRTNDKKIIVGQRDVKQDLGMYVGLLQGAAGHVNYRVDPEDVDLKKDLRKEVLEEMGIQPIHVKKLEFLGLYSNPAVAGDDLDFCFLADVQKPSDYFVNGLWKDKVKKAEHKKFFSINNFDELQRLVNDGELNGQKYDIVFSTRGPLAALNEDDFR